MGMGRSTLAVIITGSNRGAITALTGLDKQLNKVGLSVAKLTTIFATVGVAAAAATLAAVKQWADAGKELDQLSKKTGISAQTLSELKYAADTSGASISDIGTANKQLATVLADAGRGSQSAAAALATLGLSAKDLMALKPEERFLRTAEAVAGIKDESLRAAAAQDVFGKSGSQLLPMLAGGAGGLQKMRMEAQAFGLAMSGDAVASASKFSDNLERSQKNVEAMKQAWGAFLGGGAAAKSLEVLYFVLTSISGAQQRVYERLDVLREKMAQGADEDTLRQWVDLRDIYADMGYAIQDDERATMDWARSTLASIDVTREAARTANASLQDLSKSLNDALAKGLEQANRLREEIERERRRLAEANAKGWESYYNAMLAQTGRMVIGGNIASGSGYTPPAEAANPYAPVAPGTPYTPLPDAGASGQGAPTAFQGDVYIDGQKAGRIFGSRMGADVSSRAGMGG